MKIITNMKSRVSILDALNKWIDILNSDYYRNSPEKINIFDKDSGNNCEDDILEYLIKNEMEDEASDLAHATRMFICKMDYNRYTQLYEHGIKLINTVATAFPQWADILGRAIKSDLNKTCLTVAMNISSNYIKKNKWNDNSINLFVFCENEFVRNKLGQMELKYFLNLESKRKWMNENIIIKHKQNINYDIIETYYKASGIKYLPKEIYNILKKKKAVTKIQNVSNSIQASIIKKMVNREKIRIEYLISQPMTDELKIKIEHPVNLDNKTTTFYKVTPITGQNNVVEWLTPIAGSYSITVLYKGRPLIKERFLIEDEVEDSVSSVKFSRVNDGYFGLELAVTSGKVSAEILHPLFTKKTHFGFMRKTLEVVKYQSVNDKYKLFIDKDEYIDYKSGFFEFLLWNFKKTKLLYRKAVYTGKRAEGVISKKDEFHWLDSIIRKTFSYENPVTFSENILRATIGEIQSLLELKYFKYIDDKEIIKYVVNNASEYFNSLNGIVPEYVRELWKNQIVLKQIISKTKIENYGVYTLANRADMLTGDNNKEQKQYEKIHIGSYIGISYRLDNTWFKEGLEVRCDVSCIKNGVAVIEETWIDRAVLNNINHFAYKIEQENELHDGIWKFKLYNKEECILQQCIEVYI